MTNQAAPGRDDQAGSGARWAALAVLIALFATTVFVAVPAAHAQDDEFASPDQVQLDAFAVNGSASFCGDPWLAFLNGEPVPDPIVVVGEQSQVSHCFIVTNNGPEPVSLVAFETDPVLEFLGQAGISGEADNGDLLPGASALFVADNIDNAEFGVSQLAATVTWSAGASTGSTRAYVAVDARRATVSTGDYAVEVGDLVEVVFEVDASDISVAGALMELTYDPAVLQPLRDDDGEIMCFLIEAEDSLCEELDATTLDVRAVVESVPEGWTGPTRMIAVGFVAVGPGTSALDLRAEMLRPSFQLFDGFLGFTVDGSVTVAPAAAPPVLSIGDAVIDEAGVTADMRVDISPGANREPVSAVEFRVEFDPSVIQPALTETNTPVCEAAPGVVVVCGPISPDNFIDVAAYTADPEGWSERGLFSISFLPVGESGESELAIESAVAHLVNGATTNVGVQNGSLAVNIEVEEPVVLCLGQPVTINMEAGDPGLGTDGPDVILGTNGDDLIWARAGDDIVCGGGGDDVIRGGAGDDLIDGGFGADQLFGLAGDDELRGGNSADLLIGGTGDDTLMGDLGDDTLRGYAGNDQLRGGGGDDILWGDRDNDLIIGGWGNDELRGGGGDDRLFGSRGADTLRGGGGDDVLKGGDDIDGCTGGPGSDVFETCEEAS